MALKLSNPNLVFPTIDVLCVKGKISRRFTTHIMSADLFGIRSEGVGLTEERYLLKFLS